MATSTFSALHKIHTCLWFEKDAIKAAEFYVTLFKNSRIVSSDKTLVTFILDGQQISLLNGGTYYTLSPAASLFTICEDQAEVDRLWDALLADGGKEMQCGWLTDRFGVSWQIVPRCLMEMMGDSDKAKAKRATDAMMKSVKFDIDTLKKAFDGTLNHVDLLYAQGKHQNNTSLVRPPFILGLEFSGTIIALGDSTATGSHGTADGTPLCVGDKVFGASLGAFAERIVVPIGIIRHIPLGWTFEDTAGLAATASVAYGATVVRGDMRDGEWVLIHGAAGGIGVYACQIAKACGARVIAGVRSMGDSEKVRMLRALGCVDAIVETGVSADKGGESWVDDVRKITGGRGVDLVIDNVGLVKESLRCLRPIAGKIVLVGFAGREGVMEQLSLNRILLRQAVVIGYRYGETNRTNPSETKQIWDGLMDLIRSGAVRPVTFERRYRGLNEVRDAMADLQGRKIYGKAVIYIAENESDRATL
ncbi:hypothetical protein ACJ72_00466 [Emergomyces africanus]|uniref:Enoyl reductase (ER) domain-containing protein n=1 Tax=Emergomyces africanus TaxID=1955775 RepID=A0A1B7P809_9EURO|nr:hypothetical protein ACJ72_00466 [Emergomyces africanus]